MPKAQLARILKKAILGFICLGTNAVAAPQSTAEQKAPYAEAT